MTKKPRPTIAFLTHSISDAYGARLWAGAMDAAMEGNANLICYPGWAPGSTRGFEVQANIIYDFVTAESVDGVVLSGGVFSEFVGKEELEKFCERYRSLPMVSIDVALKNIPSVLAQNYQGMSEVISHLVGKHNIHRIAFLVQPMKNPQAQSRYKAYVDGLDKHGLPPDPRLVAPEATWREDTGRNAIRWLLDEQKLAIPDDFQAVVAGNDDLAYGALVELQSRGIRVPEDVVITGFDAQERGRYHTPPLTTVHQPIYEQGRKAIEMVLAQIKGEKVEDEVELPTKLVVRQSCGCSHPEVIMQTDTDIARRPDKTIKTALAASREPIQAELARIATDSSVSVPPKQVERLLDALYTDLKGDTPGTFLVILDETLQRLSSEDNDASVWYKLISIMRQHTLPCLGDDEMLFRVEDLWQHAHIMIGERMQRVQGYHRMQGEKRATTLDGISQALVSTSDEKELMVILAEGLPKLGIPGCYVSHYENPIVPTEWCQNILAYKDDCRVNVGKDKQRFQSWQLVPADMLPQDKPYSLVVEPLYFQENQIGIALFEVGPREGAVYETLRGQLSSALWGARLVQYLKSLYEASNSVISLQEPQAILQDVVEQACKAVGAKWANIVLVDKEERPHRLAVGGNRNSSFNTSILVCHEPVLITDMHTETSLLYQQMAQKGVGAAGCFPLQLRGKSVGILWIFYEKPHSFSNAEVDALRLYANQAAIAYDNARRMQELEHLRQVAEKLASVAEVQDVLKQIVQSAREVLQADSAVIWSYDAARKVFLPAELVAEGIDPGTLERYREDEPRPDGTAAIVFQKGYLAVTNVDDREYAFLIPRAHGLREAIGVRSFQGIALQVDGEPLGVLYVNYRSSQVFDEGDESTLKAFAHHAALALKKASLLEQVRRAHNTARVVAEVSVLEDLQRTLEAIVVGTKVALNCDAVVLFVYNQVTNKLDSPPIMMGVYYPKKASSAGKVLQGSLVYKMLQRDKPYIVDVMDRDPLFRERRFVEGEKIESCVAIPLQAAGQKVGVMFVNYRTRHRFTGEELADIELFAHQAAEAIRNAQLYEQTTKRATYLAALYEAGKAVTSALALDEILKRIVEQASLLTAHGGVQPRHCYLALKDNDKLRFKAAYPPGYTSKLTEKVYTIDLEQDERIDIVGRAVKTGLSQLVPDVTQDPDYRVDDPETRSELAVPIKIGEDVIGVFDVEHSNCSAFDYEDQRALEALAAQAAIAIQNAQFYENQQLHYKGLVSARTSLAWMGMASSAWRHTVDKHAVTIRDQLELLRRDIENGKSFGIDRRFIMIDRLAAEILEKPITPPLSIEEGVESIPINALIRERTRQLWQNSLYKEIVLELNLCLPETAITRASPEWLRRAFDVLIDNAQKAVDNREAKKITIGTRAVRRGAEILVSDTGPGIPEEIRAKIGLERIEKPKDAKGLGMGLLMAQTIVQTYGGEIQVGSTSLDGTTMVIRLPIEE